MGSESSEEKTNFRRPLEPDHQIFGDCPFVFGSPLYGRPIFFGMELDH
jgi:hypothetical protein